MDQNVDQGLLNRLGAVAATPQNDRTRRLAYSGGMPGLAMDARKSGLTCNPLDGGRLLTFVMGKDGYLGGWDGLNGGFRRQFIEIMPYEYLNNVVKTFYEKADYGVRPLPMLTALPHEVKWVQKEGSNDKQLVYDDMAQHYFDVVHISLSDCPSGLNRKIQKTDPRAGTSELEFQHCPTCQIAELQSEACSNRISQAVAAGMNGQILNDLRQTLIEANLASQTMAQNLVDVVKADIDARKAGSHGRLTFQTIDFIRAKMLHKTLEAPNQTAQMVETLAGAFKQAAQVPTPAPEAPIQTLTDDERTELEAFRAKQKAAADRMAAARAAKDSKGEQINVES